MAKIGDLSNQIAQALSAYTAEVEEGLQEAKTKVTKDVVSKLKRNSNTIDTGEYNKGWRVKRVGNALVVHNATNYQLTHLLEHGHAKRGGGRVQARIHIRPVEQEAIHEFEREVERVIRG